MERAKPRIVLRAGLAQANVALDHLNDVGLLLNGLGEVGQVLALSIRTDVLRIRRTSRRGFVEGVDNRGRIVERRRDYNWKAEETDMPFNPDIVVTEPGSSHVLLIVEAKTNSSPSQSEPQLKRYLWEMSCPVGLFVSPKSIALYRNSFTGYSNDSIQKLGEYSSPLSWRAFESNRSGADFETFIQSWLEKLRKNVKAVELSEEAKEALSEFVMPSLLNGEIHAAGPRLTI